MSIKELVEKIKGSLEKFNEYEKDIFLGLLVLLVGVGGFASGRLIQIENNKVPVKIEMIDLDNNKDKSNLEVVVKTQKGDSGMVNKNQTTITSEVFTKKEEKQTGVVVGSKNGNKYHLPNCSGAKRINEENKVWFTSIEEAKSAGYTAAANCPGLQ